MASNKLISGLAALAIGLSPASPALANAGDFVAGAIIGGIIGSAATQKKRRSHRVHSTQEGRQIQSSLNYFGFNAGYVDGALGRRSRAAISSYQAYMGYTPTGYLNPFEQNILLTSYQRAMVGGYGVNQVISTSPDGRRGLLVAYREEITGGAGQGATFANTQPEPVEQQQEEEVTTTTTSTSALPSFLGEAQQQSLASHCNKVSLLTNSNGGFTKASAITDANFALNEQFCLARTYAIADGEELISNVQGVAPAQITQQCEAFGPVLKDYVAEMSLQPMNDVIKNVSGFVLSTGMSPAQLAGTAKICLSVGYRTDNMDVAIGSGLLLVALGDKVYAELMGHHLSQGFGASRRIDLAMDWYAAGLDAAENGATAAFAPSQPGRTELIRAAAYQVSSGSSSLSKPENPQAASLPVFKVDN